VCAAIAPEAAAAAQAATVGSARLGTSRGRTHSRFHVDPVAGFIEFVTNLIVVIHGPRVHDLDEASSRVVGVRNGLAGKGDRTRQAKVESGKSNSVREHHGVSPSMSRMFRKLASNARDFLEACLSGVR